MFGEVLGVQCAGSIHSDTAISSFFLHSTVWKYFSGNEDIKKWQEAQTLLHQVNDKHLENQHETEIFGLFIIFKYSYLCIGSSQIYVLMIILIGTSLSRKASKNKSASIWVYLCVFLLWVWYSGTAVLSYVCLSYVIGLNSWAGT